MWALTKRPGAFCLPNFYIRVPQHRCSLHILNIPPHFNTLKRYAVKRYRVSTLTRRSSALTFGKNYDIIKLQWGDYIIDELEAASCARSWMVDGELGSWGTVRYAP